MRKFIVMLFICLVSISNASAQWIQQYVPNDAFLFGCINFENPNSGIVTGYRLGSETTEFRSFRTTNGGTNWNYVSAPDSFRVIVQFEYIGSQTAVGGGAINVNSTNRTKGNFDRNNVEEIKLGMDNVQNTKGAFFKTTNGGLNWNIITVFSPPYNYAAYLDFINPNTGMVVASMPQIEPIILPYNILKTTDGGMSWISTMPQPIIGYLKSLSYVNENLAFACGETNPRSDSSKGILLKTTNGGANWVTTINDTLLYGNLCFINSNTGFVNVFNLANKNSFSQQILKTTDQGNSWRVVLSEDSLYIGGINFYEQSGVGIMYATNTGFDIYECYSYRTSNFGETWTRHKIINSNPILLGSCMLDKYNYYVTGGGNSGNVFHTTNGGSVGVEENTGIIPDKFSILQNYPNPFNPSTSIRYNVPSWSQIILKVYNINGKEIAELVNEIKSQGSYEVKFDGINLPSGIYYYKLISGDFSETKKMLLIK